MMAGRLVLCYFAALFPLCAGRSSKLGPKARPSTTFLGELIEETGFYQSLRCEEEPVLRTQSDFQFIEVYESNHYGKVLVLDGVVQITERDANAYNEMMAHVPMFQHPNPKRVLVIGGGDGHVLSEVLKHASVEHVDHVDLDDRVIEVCKDHFSWGTAWDDPRVHLHVVDGARFVANSPDGSYDVIIQDSSDPSMTNEDGQTIELPSAVLYTSSHFVNLSRVLKPDGILNIQAESLQIPSDLASIVVWRERALSHGFEAARYGSIMISSYPTGQIGFLLCEKAPGGAASEQTLLERFVAMCERSRKTTYYQPKLQHAAFDLPLWAEERIYGGTFCPPNSTDAVLNT